MHTAYLKSKELWRVSIFCNDVIHDDTELPRQGNNHCAIFDTYRTTHQKIYDLKVLIEINYLCCTRPYLDTLTKISCEISAWFQSNKTNAHLLVGYGQTIKSHMSNGDSTTIQRLLFNSKPLKYKSMIISSDQDNCICHTRQWVAEEASALAPTFEIMQQMSSRKRHTRTSKIMHK